MSNEIYIQIFLSELDAEGLRLIINNAGLHQARRYHA